MVFSTTDQNLELLWSRYLSDFSERRGAQQMASMERSRIKTSALSVLLDILFPCKNQHTSVNHNIGVYKLVI